MNNKITKNIREVFAIQDKIFSFQSLETVQKFYQDFKDYPHPQVNYDLGTLLFIKGDRHLAKESFIKGALYGLTFPNELFNNGLIDSIGQCLSSLMTEYKIGNSEYATKATSLGYIYLSRCIELYPQGAWDSYKTRSELLRFHNDNLILQGWIFENLGIGYLIAPLFISDLYFSATIPKSPHNELITDAQKLHNNLYDISIGGKDADDYTLKELADFGSKRHTMVFKKLKKDYEAGKLDLSESQFKESIL